MGHSAPAPLDPDQPEMLVPSLRRRLAPDHSTFGNFRTRFKGPLQDLFRFIGTMAIGMGMARLNQIGLDGTRVRANSSRRRTATAHTLEERLAVVDEQVAALLARAEEEDREEDTLFGKEVSPHRLTRELANMQCRQEALAQALANARAQEAKRRAKEASSRNGHQAAAGKAAASVPARESGDSPPNPARDEGAAADWPRLPRNPATCKLDRAAFVHDAAGDCYWCPQGHRLTFARHQKQPDGTLARVYVGAACGGCPLAGECLAGKARQRSVTRDPYEPLREAMDARLRTAQGQATYERRRWACETPFAFIKAVMGVRQFLLRGLNKVRAEWKWVCSAYNLRKLVWGVARRRGYAWAQP